MYPLNVEKIAQEWIENSSPISGNYLKKLNNKLFSLVNTRQKRLAIVQEFLGYTKVNKANTLALKTFYNFLKLKVDPA